MASFRSGEKLGRLPRRCILKGDVAAAAHLHWFTLVEWLHNAHHKFFPFWNWFFEVAWGVNAYIVLLCPLVHIRNFVFDFICILHLLRLFDHTLLLQQQLVLISLQLLIRLKLFQLDCFVWVDVFGWFADGAEIRHWVVLEGEVHSRDERCVLGWLLLLFLLGRY